MKKAPFVYDLEEIIWLAGPAGVQTEIGGVWMPARPEGLFSFPSRVRAAWLVFTGRADAVRWPGNQ